MIVVLLILIFIFLVNRNNLLLSLIVLELISFIVIYFSCSIMSVLLTFDFFLILLFSIFVMEGVIGLSGLIIMVNFSGSDYIKSSRLLKC